MSYRIEEGWGLDPEDNKETQLVELTIGGVDELPEELQEQLADNTALMTLKVQGREENMKSSIKKLGEDVEEHIVSQLAMIEQMAFLQMQISNLMKLSHNKNQK